MSYIYDYIFLYSNPSIISNLHRFSFQLVNFTSRDSIHTRGLKSIPRLASTSPLYDQFSNFDRGQKPRSVSSNYQISTETFLFPPSSLLIELIYPFSTAKHTITNFLSLPFPQRYFYTQGTGIDLVTEV